MKFDGITFIGAGIVVLDRQSLFGNKYLLAAVIAHEGSHVLQSDLPAGAGCQDILYREIGDQTIPDGFDNWDAEVVMQGIASGNLGAYHVTYWVLAKLGFDVGLVRKIINNDAANGQTLVMCKDEG